MVYNLLYFSKLYKGILVQVLLGSEHTVFKIDGDIDKYRQLKEFIDLNFSAKYIKENILFIPLSTEYNHKRKFLMRWLYSEYKKETKNYKKELKFELVKRVNQPIHIHFLPQKNQAITISATFYDNHVCQLILDSKNDKCNLFLLQYFSGSIRLKSLSFNLYEVTITTPNDKHSLREFFTKKSLNGVNVSMLYNAKALELFLSLIKEELPLSDIDRAFRVLKVDKSDSLKEIKKIYKQLAKSYHPDLSKLENNESTKKFQALSEAFTLIKKYKEVA